jgi:uroporphyrin-III C-methyltransferase
MNDPRDDEPREDAASRGPDGSPAEVAGGEAPAPDRRPTSTGRAVGVVLGLFALLVACAAAGGVIYTWWQVSEQREAAAEATADLRGLVAAADGRLAAQEERLAALNREAQARRAELQSMDSELRQARNRLEAMSREEAGPEWSPSVAEVEFLLLLANRELVLGDNAKVALAALREADKRLAHLESPGFAPVRAAINDEIAAIEAVADVDVEGIALRLGSLARRVEGLPLRASLAPQLADESDADEASGWQRFRDRVGGLVAGLFRVRRSDAPAEPLLAPEESFFLYRNVELDLKSGRIAVLNRDRANYSASLAAAREAVQTYFERGDPAVQAFVAALEELEAQEIAPAWPEVSRSLELLRAAGAE